MKQLMEAFLDLVKHPKKYIGVLVAATVVILLGYLGIQQRTAREKLVFRDHLDAQAVKIDDTVLTLRELAFYVAYEEDLVEQQAVLYDPQDPAKYWNAKNSGKYILVESKENALQMAIHDEIFYQMAKKDGVELSQEERQSLSNKQVDFWGDLELNDRLQGLGVTREEMDAALEKVALAQKAQTFYAMMNQKEYEEYAFAAEAYQELLKTHTGFFLQ